MSRRPLVAQSVGSRTLRDAMVSVSHQARRVSTGSGPRAAWRSWNVRLNDRRVRLLVLGVVACLVLATRLPHLGADAPADVSWSQDLLTDPPQYTSYARNAVSFGDWNPLHDAKLIFFLKNVTGAAAFLVFTIFGPGVASANLTAVLLNLVTVGFMAWGTTRAFGRTAGLATAFFLAVNYLFVAYSRQPFLEVAANACLAVAFWSIVSSARRWWWAAVGGVVAGVGIFLAKVTSLHAAPIFLAATVLVGLSVQPTVAEPTTRRTPWWWRPVAYAAGMGLVAVLWYLLVYRSASAEVLSYLRQQSLSLYGSPVGLRSFSAFLRSWFSFGTDTGILTWSPLVSIAGLVGMCGMLLHHGRASSLKSLVKRMPPPVWLVVGWFLSAYLAFSPFNYRPVRYQIVLLLPLAAAAGWLVQLLTGGCERVAPDRSARAAWWLLPILAVILATGLQHLLLFNLVKSSGLSALGTTITMSLLLGLAVASGLVAWAVWRGRSAIALSEMWRRAGLIVAALLLVAVLVTQGARFVSWWSNAQTTIASANQDLAAVLGPDAVVTGEWSPALTQLRDSPKALNQFFSLEEAADFFARHPVTHVAVEDKADAPFFKKFPQIAQAAERVTTYTIRNLRIAVLRVADVGGNAEAARYRPSFLERLRGEMKQRPLDSLLAGLSRRVADSANNFSGWSFAADLYRRADHLDEAIYAGKRALAFSPDDFVLQVQTGDALWERYRTVGGPADRDEATTCWRRALTLSPGNPYVMERLTNAR